MTEVREILHTEIIPKFLTYLKPDDVVYEIGKGEFNYKDVVPNLVTLDKDANKRPDLEVDIEIYHDELKCNACMCVGVTEECSNPFDLIQGVYRLLEYNGIVLFGIALIGNPVYDKDYWRFTINGARKLISEFKSLEEKIVYIGNTPAYLFSIGRRL
jgi:hypothetical protein